MSSEHQQTGSSEEQLVRARRESALIQLDDFLRKGRSFPGVEGGRGTERIPITVKDTYGANELIPAMLFAAEYLRPESSEPIYGKINDDLIVYYPESDSFDITLPHGDQLVKTRILSMYEEIMNRVRAEKAELKKTTLLEKIRDYFGF